MLARYKIYRGRLPPGVTLPDGVRQDTRKHTRHWLRPPTELVEAYLTSPTAERWTTFAAEYLRTLEERYAADPAAFDALAQLAADQDVHLGCSCPTANNPDVNHCHTVLALQFMSQRYPELEVEWP